MSGGGLSRPEYLSQGVIYMIDNNYVWGGGKRKKYISPRGSIPFHYMSGRGRGRNTLVCRGIIICHGGVLGDKVIMSQGGDGIHHLSRGVTVAENLSMGVNQGNYYVLGGYGKFFLHRGVFLFTGIAHYAYWLFSLFSRHISRTQSFQHNRHVTFLCPCSTEAVGIAHKPPRSL